MGRKLLGYHDKIWEPYMEFSYTGDFEEFTLPPGEWLLECDGAPGGNTTKYSEPLYGGTSYGILNISEAKTLYATVGGVGEDGNTDHVTIAKGGWNGGGNGGAPYGAYNTGAGGGGATDIRCTTVETKHVYREIDIDTDKIELLDYVVTDGYGAVHTDYYHKERTYVEYDCNLTGARIRNYEALFGARNSSFHNAFGFFYRFAGRDNGCLTVGTKEIEASSKQTVYGERILYKVDTSKAEWFNTNGDKVGEIEVTNSGYKESKYPLLIFDTADGTDFDDASYGSMTFYQMRIYEEGTAVRCYVPAKTKSFDVTSELGEITWEQGSISKSNGDISSSTRVRTPGYIEWHYLNRPRSVRVFAQDTDGNNLDFNVMEYNSSSTCISDDDWIASGQTCDLFGNCTKLRFCLRYPDNTTDISPDKISSFRIEYVEGEIGLYEVFSKSFSQSIRYDEKSSLENSHLTAGNVITDTSVSIDNQIPMSLASRIIVAGGGGGQMWIPESSNAFTPAIGFGGGEYGGSPIIEGNDGFKYPTQTSGYAFGKGETPIPRDYAGTWCREGAGGGGGGWFGGYSARKTSTEYTSTNGGGGSGYVFTETSFLPYEGLYQPPSDLKLTDTFMSSGTSDEPKIVIYKQIDLLHFDDEIMFPCIGRTEQLILRPGIYELECYGGDGGLRRWYFTELSRSRGGYAKGILDTYSYRTAFVTVGGSGLFSNMINPDWGSKFNPTFSFNGGGLPNSTSRYATAGGGGTDIRLDENSLYSRLIVAGGAGSEGEQQSFGGSGGGLTGNKASLDTYGTTPGPGTQTESPYNSSYPEICGGFGYGGSGSHVNDGHGGAGGGGWFGGSGTRPDGASDDDEGGCGGSGYVLTETSFKPEGYLLTNPQDYLTNTELVTGGNNLTRGRTLAKIKVLKIKRFMMCSDENMETFYRFDSDNSQWIPFKYEMPTDEEFYEYGITDITSDEGLPNKYKIIFKSDDELDEGVGVSVVPNEQTIQIVLEDDQLVGSYFVDTNDFDKSVYDVKADIHRRKLPDNTIIDVQLKINKKQESDDIAKIYLMDIDDT